MIIRFIDGDDDGFGDLNEPVLACPDDEETVDIRGDCDDNNVDTHPRAEEICDEFDNDRNGEVNDGLGGQGADWFEDQDVDGWGNEINSVTECTAPMRYVARASDCMDDEPSVHPDPHEKSCDLIDQNCDGQLNDSGRDPECNG